MIVPSIASIRLTWPSTWLAQVGRVRVLEVGHEALGARVERVDDELAVGRPGDLDAAVLVVRRRRGRPASRPRGSRASRRGSRACRRSASSAARSRRAASSSWRRGSKRPCSSARNVERVGGEDVAARSLAVRGRRRQARCSWARPSDRDWSSQSVIGWKIGQLGRSRCAAIWSAQPGVGGGDRLGAGGGEVRGLALARARRRPRAARGCRCPAEPQQISHSAGSTSSRPGIARSSSRGCARTPCACARWQASW